MSTSLPVATSRNTARATGSDVWRPLLVAAAPDAAAPDAAAPDAAAPDATEAPATFEMPVSAIAHDLRGPLTALAASAEILVEDFDTLGRDDVQQRLRGIQRRALWLQGLVENVLCAASINEGRFGLQTQPIDLVELMSETQCVVEPLLAQKRQQLSLDARGLTTSQSIAGDSRRLAQVLVNLVLNASKFAAAGTRINVTATSVAPDRVRVTVADRGPGLPEGPVARLFEPFQRGVAADSGAPDGVGLGLAIVHSVITAHGGSVRARNRKGGGAEFWFELPTTPQLTTDN